MLASPPSCAGKADLTAPSSLPALFFPPVSQEDLTAHPPCYPSGILYFSVRIRDSAAPVLLLLGEPGYSSEGSARLGGIVWVVFEETGQGSPTSPPISQSRDTASRSHSLSPCAGVGGHAALPQVLLQLPGWGPGPGVPERPSCLGLLNPTRAPRPRFPAFQMILEASHPSLLLSGRCHALWCAHNWLFCFSTRM